MFAEWFRDNIFSGSPAFNLGYGAFRFFVYPYDIFGFVMLILFLWASFHLITDIIMAFRAVFGFGYKKRKGGSH